MSPSTLEALRALQAAPQPADPPAAHGDAVASSAAVSIGLLVVGLLAAAAIVASVVRDTTLAALERRAAVEVDALVMDSARVRTALETFDTAREPDSAWFAQTSALVAALGERARSVDATLPAIAAAPRAQLAEALRSADEAVERAHANATADRSLMAHDVIESNGKPAADTLDASLAALRTAIADEIGTQRGRWRMVGGLVLAVWALVWGIGLAWLTRALKGVRSPLAHDVRPAVASEAAAEAPPAQTPAAAEPVDPAEVSQPAEPPPAAQPTLPLLPTPAPAMAASSPRMHDPARVADACEVVANLTDAAQMASALQGMAQALGASGLVLWMRDGNELAAAAAHGYPPGVPQRLGRVSADDQNLIARAWQARASQTVPEAPGQRAAVAAPIGAAGVVTGVLAAELPAGREPDADIVATSRILAAQLSAVLGEATAAGGAAPFEATGS